MLKALLYADLERQLELSGQPVLKLPCPVSCAGCLIPGFCPFSFAAPAVRPFLTVFRP